ncbi:DeoR/GlpR transcriptional regulator [Curvibacter sp. CHRR-16]|uniref:DeoR/GlpR family DNA-binding transcription regulator n=1 Tax=Curvibacter sp. CHRR-16 TaxID=2835872 RepID=UPI001BD96009|nr:DeoR/GlpR family DNA-binding transcription regulator [Curvibacter sp. CHRR-16]MBT0570007.1 DeoR/GlpR transcriptional regulator [Curvibacter sp. CHRR-16]
MQHHPRHTQIVQTVERLGHASVEELASQLGVTVQTVRRDIQKLAAAGLVRRFHGGARAAVSTTENLAHTQRETLHAHDKQRIARRIAADVPNDCSLILNVGTTAEAVARELLQHQGLRVLTNNLNIATTLCSNPSCEVIVAGGVVRARDHAIIGEAAVDFVRQFKVDIAIIGISGIEGDGTLRDYDYREVKVAQTIMQHAREVWLVADSSKFNRPAMVQVGQLAQLDRLYTNAIPPEPFTRLLDEAGVQLVISN